MVGPDATQRTTMSTDYLLALASDAGEAGAFIWDIPRFYEAFHRAGGVPSIFVHDSSAAAYLLAPELFTTRTGSIRIITEDLAFGQTIQKPDGVSLPPGAWDSRPSHAVCVEVDSDGLLALDRKTLLGRRAAGYLSWAPHAASIPAP